MLHAARGVEVVSVRTDLKRLQGQSQPWMETAIHLRAVDDKVEDVNVQLWLRFKNTKGIARVYTGKARLYALDRTAIVRFYLPPDVIRVRRLSNNPEAYYLTLSSSEGTELYERLHASPSLATPSERHAVSTSFADPLLPHYATPFYSLPETWRDLPSYDVD